MELTPIKYKQTEVGMIPEDWYLSEIENFSVITTGSSDTQDKIENGIYPFYVRSNTVERINKYSFDGEAVLTSGDGVGVGKIFHYANGKFDFHQRVYCIYNFRNVDGKYFYLQFSRRFFDRVMSMTAKSSVDSVRKEMIAKMKIPLPPTLIEQKAISQVLSDTDALIQALKKKITKKKQIKKGTMQKLLSPKEDWEVKTLGEVGEIITGGTPPTTIKSYWDGKIPWVTPTDIRAEKNIKSSEREITKEGLGVIRKLPPDTLLVTCIASIGKNAILRKAGACNQQINAIVPNDSNNVDFLYYLIENNASYIKGKAGITATLLISKKDFSEITFAFPKSKIEQNQIAKILSDIDLELELLKQKLSKYQLAKQGMMQKLLTGKIRLV